MYVLAAVKNRVDYFSVKLFKIIYFR